MQKPMVSNKHDSNIAGNRGFALVVTVSLLVLLSVVALGMLSLSAVTLRAGSQDSAAMEARTNARLALMIALGELQKEMGPDQRISANAEILDTSGSFDVTQKHWMGSWDSWIAGTMPANVNPNYPSVASHHQTLGSQADNSMRPEYTNKNAHFRSWLVSLDPASADDLSKVTGNYPANLAPGKTDKTITLVGEGSLGGGVATDEIITVPLLSRVDQNGGVAGRYGYWVGDENQKARLMQDAYQGTTFSSAEKIYRRQAPGSTGTKVAAGLETMTNDSEVSRLATLGSLDLLTGATGKPYHNNFHAATVHSRGVLADVREGGLKRDLSTILERAISTSDNAPEFMLYEFDDPRFPDRSNSRVPIQDLAAYYQLYDNDASWAKNRRGGVTYHSTALANSIQVTTPNYDGGTKDRLKYQGEYAGLYKQPAIAKVQFLLAIGAQEVTDADRANILNRIATLGYLKNAAPMRDSDTHKLLLGIMPVITLWNPNNLPMVMDQSQVLRFCTPPFALRWRKYRAAGPTKDFLYFNLNYAMGGSSVNSGVAEPTRPYIISYRFARNNPIVFEPGEVKMFSAPSTAGGTLKEVADVAQFRNNLIDPVNNWDPNGLFLMPRVTPAAEPGASPDAYDFALPGEWNEKVRAHMVFERNDRITLEIISEKSSNNYQDGRRTSRRSEVLGSAFNISMTDEGFYVRNNVDFFRHYQMLSRHGGTWTHASTLQQIEIDQVLFNQALFNPAFPDGTGVINFKNQTNALSCGNIIDASAAGDAIGLMEFSLSYGCEVGLGSLGGYSSGRRIASRPFLHSGLNAAPSMDQSDKASLYNYGWDWQINQINNIEDSVVQGEPDTGRGYFGGGYTIEAGTTHVVQREIPVLPPISIASLSHAHLGGFSLARNNTVGQNPATDNYAMGVGTGNATNRVQVPIGVDYQQVTATGQGGLAPHVVQAIGNSYAHPNLAADKAFAFKPRQLDGQETSVNAPFVDHSYLANKALWDDYFFSSISPQLSNPLNAGAAAKTATQVANDFFFDNKLLPNRRIAPYSVSLTTDVLNTLTGQLDTYTDGFADKIASHLMVDGSFNGSSAEYVWILGRERAVKVA